MVMTIRQQCCAIILCMLTSMFSLYGVNPNTVVATINTGVTPAGLAITDNGQFAYVANNNNYGIAQADSVSVLDLDSNLPETIITHASFDEPYTVTINSHNGIAYVTNSAGSTITMINTANNTVVGTISGFDGPSGMVISPDGTKAYVNNYGGPILGSGNGKTVRVVDLINNTIIGSPITVGLAPAALAMSPDGQFVYTINYVTGNPGTGTMSVIRTSDNTVVNMASGFSGPFGIAVTPNGKYAYVTNFGSNNFAPFGSTVSVVDLHTFTIVKTINVGIQPSGISISPDGRFAYVSNYNTLYAGSNFTDLTAGEGTVNIIDTKTNEVIPPTIMVGQSPANIAVSPDGEFAYVSNYTSNAVTVIALQSFVICAKGCKTKHSNKRANKLTWKASGSSLPIEYGIYRNPAFENVAVVLPAKKSMTYVDEDVKKDVKYTYYIVGVNAAGTASVPVVVKVSKECKKD